LLFVKLTGQLWSLLDLGQNGLRLMHSGRHITTTRTAVSPKPLALQMEE
ncbi:unnamed protein product, partial [Allacma fusca]